MASSSSAAALVLVIMTAFLCLSFSQALTINNVVITQALFEATAVCPNSVQTLITSAPVALLCGPPSAEVQVKATATDLTGKYAFSFILADLTLYDPTTCYIKVSIPATECSLPLPTGYLKVPLVVSEVIQSALGGPLCVLVSGAISHIV